MTIYIAMRSDYDSGIVLGAFTDKAKAERCRCAYHGTHIEEMVLDAVDLPPEEGMKRYLVWQHDGDPSLDFSFEWHGGDTGEPHSDKFLAWAKDEIHAIEVAKEIRKNRGQK